MDVRSSGRYGENIYGFTQETHVTQETQAVRVKGRVMAVIYVYCEIE